MKQKKVIKLTESDLRRIISEKLEGDMSEGPGLLGSLLNRAKSAVSKPKAVATYATRVVSTMRREVTELLTKTPTIKITPKTVKVLEEPRYNVRVAYDQVHELATEGLESSIRADLMGIDMALQRVKTELMKPAGQTLNIKKMMEDLYYVKDELTQDILKRPGLVKDVSTLQKPLIKVIGTIDHIETLFKTPDKPTSYLVKE